MQGCALIKTEWQNRLAARLCSLRQEITLRALAPLTSTGMRRQTEGFGILTYHRVTPEFPAAGRPTWNVTPERFRQQLAGLLRRNYRPWPLRRVLEYHQQGKTIPRETFVLTFDDGYESVYRYAWPILRELGIPATLLLATAYLDSSCPFPFDDWPARGSAGVPAVAWRPLSTQQCAALMADGLIELGTHTHTHADFRGRPDLLCEDLGTSLELLRRRFGLTNAPFSFPYGRKGGGFAGAELAAAAQRAGTSCALTTENELVTPACLPFDWGRFSIRRTDTAATIAVQLEGVYTRVRNCWRRLRHPGQARETIVIPEIAHLPEMVHTAGVAAQRSS